jgi:hypothetical protein
LKPLKWRLKNRWLPGGGWQCVVKFMNVPEQIDQINYNLEIANLTAGLKTRTFLHAEERAQLDLLLRQILRFLPDNEAAIMSASGASPDWRNNRRSS